MISEPSWAPQPDRTTPTRVAMAKRYQKSHPSGNAGRAANPALHTLLAPPPANRISHRRSEQPHPSAPSRAPLMGEVPWAMASRARCI